MDGGERGPGLLPQHHPGQRAGHRQEELRQMHREWKGGGVGSSFIAHLHAFILPPSFTWLVVQSVQIRLVVLVRSVQIRLVVLVQSVQIRQMEEVKIDRKSVV